MSCWCKKSCFLVVVILIAIAAALLWYFSPEKGAGHHDAPVNQIAGRYLSTPRDLKPFMLTDINGEPFTLTSLEGHWSLLYFGYTRCTHKCPVSFSALQEMYQQLQATMPEAQLPHVFFVTLDPKRDTSSDISHFVHTYNPTFSGALSDMPHILQLSQQLDVTFHVVSLSNASSTNYNIAHSAEVAVIDPEAQVVAFLAYPQQGGVLAEDYMTIVDVLTAYDKSKLM